MTILHPEVTRFLREREESTGNKVGPVNQNAKTEENIKRKKTDKRWKNTKIKEPPSEENDLDIDGEGVIEADSSASQERSDKNVEVTKETKRALNDVSCRKPLICS